MQPIMQQLWLRMIKTSLQTQFLYQVGNNLQMVTIVGNRMQRAIANGHAVMQQYGLPRTKMSLQPWDIKRRQSILLITIKG